MTLPEYCNSLVGSIVVVRDGKDHCREACRCITAGECVGYYTKLLKYEKETDRFLIGYNNWIPTDFVDEVRVYTLLLEMGDLMESVRKLFKDK